MLGTISQVLDYCKKGVKVMKATGIVRRIDDLGRIVIPKEIRNTFAIEEGTQLEIFVDSEYGIILKKYECDPLVDKVKSFLYELRHDETVSNYTKDHSSKKLHEIIELLEKND